MIRLTRTFPVALTATATALVALFSGGPAQAHTGHGELIPHAHPHGAEHSLADALPYGLGIALAIGAVGLVLALRAVGHRAAARSEGTARRIRRRP